MGVTADDVSNAVEGVEGDGEGGDNPEPEGRPDEPEANGNGQEPEGEGDKGSNLPPKLEGKSEEELAEMYLNLEDKLGEQGQQIAELRGRLEGQADANGDGDDVDAEPDSPTDKSAEEVAEQLAEKYDLPDDVLDMEPKKLIGIVTKASAEVSQQQANQVVEEEVNPVKEEQARNQADKLVQTVQQQHEDFAQHKGEVLEKVQQPQYQAALENAETFDQQVSVLEDIYKIVSSGAQSDNTQNGDTPDQNGRNTPDSSNARQTGGRGASNGGGSNNSQEEEQIEQRVRESMGLG